MKQLGYSAFCPICILLTLFCLLTACGDDDDYHYPSVKLEFLTAYTDANGVVERVCTDAGETWPVLQTSAATVVKADTAYRIVTNYEPVTASDGTQGVKLYAWSNAISPLPLPASEFKEGVRCEPAEVASIWMGYEYLNMLLTVKQQGKHSLHFVEETVEVDTDSRCSTVYLSLYHAVTSEVQDYTKRAYLSVPLYPYLKDGVEKLKVFFSWINESGEKKTYSCEYTDLNP
ncbi:MAG: hypothetical protein IJ494_09320 [Bacteroides sp.]|nr:hypothetical protein [Bacteroides sp.]